MVDYTENSIKREDILYEVESVLPSERLDELHYLLNNFKDNWGFLFINLYPFEIKKLLNAFPHFEFFIFEDNENFPTIFCRISRISH